MIHRCRSCGLKCRVLCVDLTAPFAVPSERAPPSQFCPHHSPPWLYAEFLSVFTPYFVICKAPGRLGGPSVAVHVPCFSVPFFAFVWMASSLAPPHPTHVRVFVLCGYQSTVGGSSVLTSTTTTAPTPALARIQGGKAGAKAAARRPISRTATDDTASAFSGASVTTPQQRKSSKGMYCKSGRRRECLGHEAQYAGRAYGSVYVCVCVRVCVSVCV